MTTKIVALYLPQFYETEYNSRWWGEGYTDWVACKNAKPLFEGHRQPRIPLNQRYYDLSDTESIKYQIELAREYGIDGFAIYHYYSVGKTLLDVPLELLKRDKDLNFPFYFFWANEAWRRTWYGNENELLWEQHYGNQAAWRQHYEYCREFFVLDHYMKIEGKPIFTIYKSWHFKDLNKFIAAWNQWAADDGFEGIYFVKALGRKDDHELGSFNAVVTREPNYTFAFNETISQKFMRVLSSNIRRTLNSEVFSKFLKKRVVFKVDYEKVWSKIIEKTPYSPHVFPGGFVDWDATPRKGFDATIVTGSSPDLFRVYFEEMYNRARDAKCPMVVLNAWNEWGEGAYLEPDEENKFKYLEAIRAVKKTKV